MRKIDIAKGCVWAAASFAAAVFVTSPSNLNATDAPGHPKTAIATPTLVIDDVRFSVAFADETKPADATAARVFKAGAMPQLQLVATNTTNAAKTATWKANVSVAPPTSPLARVVPTPKVQWTRQDKALLQPGQTVRIPLDTKLSLKKGETVTVQLIGNEAQLPIAALRFAAEPIPLAQALQQTKTRANADAF